MVSLGEFLELHELFLGIVGDEVGGVVPLPSEVTSVVLKREGAVPQAAQHWLKLLDLCVSPALFRTGIQRHAPDQATIRAAVRYLAGKDRHNEADRDRLDWLLTYVFKQQQLTGGELSFARIRTTTLAWMTGMNRDGLSEAARNLLSQVTIAVEEVNSMSSFEQLTESGLIQRGRELKQNLKQEFFHAEVLPAIVHYNLVFGRQFDKLFAEAANQARELAAGLGSKDYRSTGEDFRRLSRVVKSRKAAGTAGSGPAVSRPAAGIAGAAAHTHAATQDAIERFKALGIDPVWHEGQLRLMVGQVASFVRAAGRTVNAVPLASGVLNVFEWESIAFTLDLSAADKSFRAELNRELQQAVGCLARIQEELSQYQGKRDSEYLWKVHYDALIYLLYYGQRQIVKLQQLADNAKNRGLIDKSGNLVKTLEKLRDVLGQVAQVIGVRD